MGILPPLTNQAWIDIFENYKLTPEYQIVNFSISLKEFKFIFWWEWFHRFLARFIGFIFIIPFIYYFIKKKLTKNILITVVIVFLFGAFQGLIGWWMVKSGFNR